MTDRNDPQRRDPRSQPIKLDKSDRRFSDQEVALVLQRAADIEEHRAVSSSAPRGLTLRELHEIGREVGLSAEVIDEAVRTLQARGRPRSGFPLAAPLSCKLVRAVPGQLDEADLQRLIQVIENEVDATGTVTEALGTVRWTSVSRGHKFDRTLQVSLSKGNDETQVQVVQRYPSGLRSILHFLPGAWGAMIGAAVSASVGIAPLAFVGATVAAAALGIGIGRGIWQTIARRSEREVERVSKELVAAANQLIAD